MTAQLDVQTGFKAGESNQHYLRHVAELSESNPVVTREDVYDVHGIKLITKGARVDHSVYERLLRYKLTKPIETMLNVEDAVSALELTELAEELMAANSHISQIVDTIDADGVALELVRRMRLDSTGSLMLSLQRKENVRLRHGLVVSLLAVGIGHKIQLPQQHVEALVCAGMLHDVGELYLDPAIYATTDNLTPDQWRQVASHPLIGETVIRETMDYPREVSRFVAEHHERISGYGYPRLLSGKSMTRAGICLGVAEQAAGILGQEKPDLGRLACAMRLVHGEFPAITVTMMDTVYRALRDALGIPESLLHGTAVITRSQELAQLLNRAIEWIEAKEPSQPGIAMLIDFVRTRLLILRKSAHSAGILGFTAPSVGTEAELPEGDIREIDHISHELWRRLKELPGLASLIADPAKTDARDFVNGFAQCLGGRLQFE